MMSMERVRRGATYENKNDGAEIHQLLNGGLVERIIDRVRVFVVALVTDPRHIRTSRTWSGRAAFADKLELSKALVEINR